MTLSLTPTLDISSLRKPYDVQLPEIKGSYNFISQENWLDDIVARILKEYERADGIDRVRPMALARCSRGGKTRALMEIAKALKEFRPDIVIIYVSFNDGTDAFEDEREDMIGALCRRIAFAAQKGHQGFEEFRKKSVSPDLIVEWLKDLNCILLIDELNTLLTRDMKVSKKGATFARWLKINFLVGSNRYFLFSSHESRTIEGLSAFLDNNSN